MQKITVINKPLRKGLRKKVRHYVVDKNEYVSVTTPLSLMSFQYIDLWKLRVGATKAGIIGKKAGNYGNKMHDYFEKVCQNKKFKVKKKYQKDLKAFKKWFDENVEEVIATEKIVYSHKHKLAGRYDFLGRIKGYKGICIVDWKTGRLKPEHFLQLAAYRVLTAETDNAPIQNIKHRLVVGVRDGKVKMLPSNPKAPKSDKTIDSDWDIYKAILKVWRWKNKI